MDPNELSGGVRAAGFARAPRATYRVQLHAGFDFAAAEAIVPYLAALGVGDLYCSPFLRARPGSTHGYDVLQHDAFNPEIGDEAAHAALSAALRAHGMGQLIDIVPNHMGIGPGNGWWMDVLENGPASPYAGHFDIDWDAGGRAALEGKVLLPVLGDQYGRVLERGELRLELEDGRFHVAYFDRRFPVAPRPTAGVLREALARLEAPEDDADRMELESIARALELLPGRRSTDAASIAERRRERTVSRRRLAALCASGDAVAAALDAAVDAFNGTPDDPRSFDRLDALLDEQAYRLAFWRVAAEEINYRRFFDINDLAGIRVEVPHVFQETHRLVLRLVREGKVTGLRIDHPDGLFHPADYLRDLQRETVGIDATERFYVVVEKILTGEEPLPPEWPVAGTVGYEFLHRVNALFVPPSAEARMDEAYRRFARTRAAFRDVVHENQRLILRTSLVSELTVLTHLLARLSDADRRSRDFTWGSLREALREVIAAFPVYRTYIDAVAGKVSETDRRWVEMAVRRAKRRNPAMSAFVFDYLRSVLLLDWPPDLPPALREEHARFVMKFQQLTGPVMAKGVEDTSFYRFQRLVSLNEVGGEPDRFGASPEELHVWLAERAERWPLALSASSTHDTKRAEDVRARINVLAELPDRWEACAWRWAELNRAFKGEDDGAPLPDANDEYLLYQTLVGAWPLEERDDAAHADFVGRIRAYMEKATREAKVHTSWINPNETYDAALAAFVERILRPGENPFLDDLRALVAVVAPMGMVNALAQTLVKLVAPGVPDVYQGQEVWDFSLVDPDNRRPVDYDRRRRLLERLDAREAEAGRGALARELVAGWTDGAIKLHLVRRALHLRRERPLLLAEGAYVPLAVAGGRAAHLFAFARTRGEEAVVAVVPRLVATMMGERAPALPAAADWRDTRLSDPLLAGRWRDVLTGAEVEVGEDGSIEAGVLLDAFPVALLERAAPTPAA